MKEIIKIRAEIDEIENRKQQRKIYLIKNCLTEKINKGDRPLVKMRN